MSTPLRSDAGRAEERFTPVYYRIQEHLRSEIGSGRLQAGARLPSESELSRQFRTTRSTVRHALSLLVFEGLIERHVGRGTFVALRSTVTSPIDTRQCLSFEDQVALSGKTVTYRSPSLQRVEAPAEVADRLGLEPGDHVYCIKRLRVIDGRPACLEVRYLPVPLGLRITQAMLERRSVHDFLSEIIGDRIPTIVVSVMATSADAATASLLEVPRNSALAVREHTYHDVSGKVILCGNSIFRGDIRIEYVLGREPRLPDGA